MDIKRTITQLTDELGEERVLTRTAIGADYCHDEYPGRKLCSRCRNRSPHHRGGLEGAQGLLRKRRFRHRSRRRHRSGGRLGLQ